MAARLLGYTVLLGALVGQTCATLGHEVVHGDSLE